MVKHANKPRWWRISELAVIALGGLDVSPYDDDDGSHSSACQTG